jgi:hypothetical protein
LQLERHASLPVCADAAEAIGALAALRSSPGGTDDGDDPFDVCVVRGTLVSSREEDPSAH